MLRCGAAFRGMQGRSQSSTLLNLLETLPQRRIQTQATPSPFAAQKLPELKALCRSLGLRTTLKKAELVAMLDAYYAERGEVPNIAPQNDTKTPSESPDTSTIPIADSDSSVEFIRVAHRSPTSRRKSKTNATGDLEKAMEAINLSSSSAESDVPGSSDSEAIESAETQESLALDLYGSEANDLDEVLCNAIYQDKQLYRRILLLEPIPLDEMVGLGKRLNLLPGSIVKNRARMRTWLDTQGICFYEADLN